MSAIRVPTPIEESVRDLCRARADMVADLDRARRRLGALLLRHGQVWRGGTRWTLKHHAWISSLSFDRPALQATLSHYRAVVEVRTAEVEAIERDLLAYSDLEPFADAVRRLCAYRGVARVGALTLASEVCDWARFPRASAFMGFAGLGVTEYSTGGKTRRGHITKTGSTHLRTQLVEAAWSYQHGPSVGPTLRRRQEACTPDTVARSWAAQRRLCARFRTLAARKNVKSVVAAAVARELGGFLWGEKTA